MTDTINFILWVVFPWAMMASFVGGIIWVFATKNWTVTAKSSEVLEKKQLMWGSIFLHVGILGELAGHIQGMLIPESFMTAIGNGPKQFEMIANIGGAVFGTIIFIGILILTYRRFTNARVFFTSSWTDIVVDVALLVIIVFGMMSSFIASPLHLGGANFDYRQVIGVWARSLFSFNVQWRPMIDVYWIYKAHMIAAFALMGFFPYTRLMHALTIPMQYIFRRLIVYRTKKDSAAEKALDKK